MAEPKTLGEHLRKRRLDLGLTHRQAAAALGIHPKYIAPLEKDRHRPTARALAAILRFLGYEDPVPVPHALPERLRAARRGLGLNRSTIQDAENGRGRRQGQVLRNLKRFLEGADIGPKE